MKKKLLLADDSTTIQKVIQLCFADESVEISVAQDGEQALQALRAWQPDILLADVLLPGVDGYELARVAREENGIAVVLLVGTFEPFDSERAEKSGYDIYFTKPFDTQHLIRSVLDLANRGRKSAVPIKKLSPVLEFQESPVPATPGILQFADASLTPWSYEVAPQRSPDLPPPPVFRASSRAPAASGSAPPLAPDVEAALERLLPRWLETMRSDLREELKRLS